MPNFKDLTNKEFDRLTVKNIVYERDPDGRIQWDCLCICGNWKRTTGHALKQRWVKSCGCLKQKSSSKKAKLLNSTGRNKHRRSKQLLLELYKCVDSNKSTDKIMNEIKSFLRI